MPKNMGYDPQMVKKLSAIRDRAWAYTWLHRENAQQLKNWYDRTSYLNIFLQLLTGTSIFVTASVCQDVYYVRILTGIMSIISGFISALLKHEDYGQEIMKHKNASSKYSRIYDSIDNQLDTPAHAQQQAHHFHNWISHEFDTLFSTAPDLDSEVILSYTRKFGTKRHSHPIEAAEFEKDSEENKLETNSHNEIDLEAGKTENLESEKTVSDSETETDTETTETEHSEKLKQKDSVSLFEGAKDSEGTKDSEKPKDTEERKDTDEEKLQPKKLSKRKPTVKKDSIQAEQDLKKLLEKMRVESGNIFTPMLYDYQSSRMSLNTDKCYIDPFDLEKN